MAESSDTRQVIREIERRLIDARAARDRASQTLRSGKGGEWDALWAAGDLVTDLERDLAAARGEEYAKPIDFPVQWCTGAPLPHLLTNGHRCFLIFLERNVDPAWDGSYITIKHPGSDRDEPLGLVEFNRCVSTRFGTPNDEVWDGHPLARRGLQAHAAQEVINSRWLSELERINSVHAGYCPETWRTLHHYIFWFHDETFEAVAESFKVERHTKPIRELLAEVCFRLIS